MMQFVFSTIFMIAVGAVLYLGARALPRIPENTVAPKTGSFWGRLLASGLPQKTDQLVSKYAGRFFRRLKIWLLRWDNYLTKRLQKMNTESTDRPRLDFEQIKEIVAESYTGPDRRQVERRRKIDRYAGSAEEGKKT